MSDRELKKQVRKLTREKLEALFARLEPLRDTPPPSKGWLRTIREALGMNGRQFAARLGVTPARVCTLEQNELTGSLTIQTLQRAADALDCDLVYALLPRTGLEEMVREQAEQIAARKLARAAQQKPGAGQSLTVAELEKGLHLLVDELVGKEPKSLWDP